MCSILFITLLIEISHFPISHHDLIINYICTFGLGMYMEFPSNLNSIDSYLAVHCTLSFQNIMHRECDSNLHKIQCLTPVHSERVVYAMSDVMCQKTRNSGTRKMNKNLTSPAPIVLYCM